MANPKIFRVCKLTNRNSWWSFGRRFPLSCGRIVAVATLPGKPCMFEHVVLLPLKPVIFESTQSLSHITCDVSLLALKATAVCDLYPCCQVSVWAVQKFTEANKLLVQRHNNLCIKYHTGLLHSLFRTFVNFLCPVCPPKIMVLRFSAVTIIFLRSRWKWTVIWKKRPERAQWRPELLGWTYQEPQQTEDNLSYTGS